MNEFVECDSCSSKCGSPTLCQGCVDNRKTFYAMEREIDALKADIARCTVTCGGCSKTVAVKITTKLKSGVRICTKCLEDAHIEEVISSITGD